MVTDRPEVQTTNSKSRTNSNDNAASRALDDRSLRGALYQGLENAASNPATPIEDDTLRGALDKGLTNATAADVDYQRQADEKRKQKVRIKNRRRMYLDSHPEYFEDPDLELAGNYGSFLFSLFPPCCFVANYKKIRCCMIGV